MFNNISVIVSVLAFISGLIFTCVSILQISHLYKTKNSKGISILSYVFILTAMACNMPYLFYIKANILILYTAIHFFQNLIVVIMTLYYRKKIIKLDIIQTSNHSLSKIEVLSLTETYEDPVINMEDIV